MRTVLLTCAFAGIAGAARNTLENLTPSMDWRRSEVPDARRRVAPFLQINEEFPGIRKVSNDPKVYVIDNFVSVDEARWLIEAGRDSLAHSSVVNENNINSKSRYDSTVRTSSNTALTKTAAMWLHSRVANLTHKHIESQEEIQITRYLAGQKFDKHQDGFHLTPQVSQTVLNYGGQRVCTILIYLNDVAEGGGTTFTRNPRVGTVQPKQGMAVVFFPGTLDGYVDGMAEHVATPAKDEKWVAQCWVRQYAMDAETNVPYAGIGPDFHPTQHKKHSLPPNRWATGFPMSDGHVAMTYSHGQRR